MHNLIKLAQHSSNEKKAENETAKAALIGDSRDGARQRPELAVRCGLLHLEVDKETYQTEESEHTPLTGHLYPIFFIFRP